MDQSFDPERFIRRIGERLVDEFSDAKAGTTPLGVGTAAEQPVRKQLKSVLPRGIVVGEGFVIDSYGGTSRQQDVVLYERDICPVFSVNDTPHTTYYPIEGVIGVGEIKSWLDRQEIRDAFDKIASVKKLRRHVVSDSMPHPTTGEPMPLSRNYLTYHRNDAIFSVDKATKPEARLEVFGFVLAGASRLGLNALVDAFRDIAAEVGHTVSPNLLGTMDGHVLSWGNMAKQKSEEVHRSDSGTYGVTVYHDGPVSWQPARSSQTGSQVGGYTDADAFRLLVRWIRQAVEIGRTSDIRSFDRYFDENKDSRRRQIYAVQMDSQDGSTAGGSSR